MTKCNYQCFRQKLNYRFCIDKRGLLFENKKLLPAYNVRNKQI